jgi:solute carrier family 50 protein (sugar transporter)
MVSQSMIDAVALAGTALVFLMLSSQLPAMWRVIRYTRSVAGLSVAPTVGQLANFATWVIYGLTKDDWSIVRVNLIGCGFGVFYLAIFLCYASGSNQTQLHKLLVGSVLLIGGTETAFYLGVSDHNLRLTLMGWLAVACNVLMYAAPIGSLRVALATMNPAAMPMLLTIANFLCGLAWMFYGIFVSNWFVTGPNIAGTVLNTAQLVVACYVACAAVRTMLMGWHMGGHACLHVRVI